MRTKKVFHFSEVKRTSSIYHLWVLALGFLFLSACSSGKERRVEIESPEEVAQTQEETAEIVDTSFKDGMTGKMWHNYLNVRTALVYSDEKGVRKAAGNMAESFGDKMPEMKALAKKLAKSDNLDDQKQLFYQYSQKLDVALRDALSEGEIYKLYCPMAFNNEGAFWFSEVKEIKNPYFGEQMLRCGSVKEVIQ